MISKVGNGDIKIDEITALYLKDKEGNMVELFKGNDFNYDYKCNSYGKRKLNINCDLSGKGDLLLRIQNNIPIYIKRWGITNIFNRGSVSK